MPPTPVVCALIWNPSQTQLLIARRPPGKHLAGLWEFPGGKIDPGESAPTALHRELQEELGCQVEILETLPDILHTYPWVTIRMTPFICRLTPDSPPPQPLEHTHLAWISWSDLPSYTLAPADLPLLSSYHPRPHA
jgi:8-oxo-dGTP diphosphatase